MQVADALSVLGVDRVIWVDDLFNKSAPDLAAMLLNAYEIALECKFEDIAPILEKKPFGGDELAEELAERLAELGAERSAQIREIFLAKEPVQKMFATAEMTGPAVDRVCDLLRIKPEDRWNFDKALAELPALCKGGDASVAYIVDLNETGVSPFRGLDILEALHAHKSVGTAFILTHEAGENDEVAKEIDLRSRLMEARGDGLEIPISVIAKQRLLAPESEKDVEENLNVAVKRAGLRKSLSSVVASAKNVVVEAFESAATGLLSIPPEQLEEYVVERAYKEGVSELHVVERILTSQIAQKLRIFFGTDNDALASAYRLRGLREIKLGPPTTEADVRLAKFRLAEVWEGPDLINRALAPIACGDVFETDEYERVPGKKKIFVLLAQPCDIALRPENKSRARDTGFLVPLSKLTELSQARNRDFVLPCKLDDSYWECDFGATSTVRLAVLDLASFRTDGRVRVDAGHKAPKDLVASQNRIYERRTASATKALSNGAFIDAGNRSIHPSLQLAFTWEEVFKQFFCASLCEAARENKQSGIPALPKRITWRLKRAGRVRMPYAIALLDYYLAGMSRYAFDLDYISPGQNGSAERDKLPRKAEASVTGLKTGRVATEAAVETTRDSD